jgi:single-strand DNA-binding protein
MNNYFAIGRLVRDIEVRYTTSNKPVASFTIAITRSFKNQKGEYESDFINCELWNKIAETMKTYTHKGDQIAISGSLRTETYQDKEGNKKARTYVLVDQVKFLTYKKDEKIDNGLPEDNLEMPF